MQTALAMDNLVEERYVHGMQTTLAFTFLKIAVRD